MNSTLKFSMSHHRNEQVNIPFFQKLIATGFFSGYSPLFPGTAGSLVGLAFYAIPGIEGAYIFSTVIIVTFFLGVITSKYIEARLGDDPQIIVIDEIVGMWISLYLIPKSLWLIILAFILFRFYDIVKPSPARNIEKVKNGWGIMLDDVFAGVYANISVRVLMYIFPGLI